MLSYDAYYALDWVPVAVLFGSFWIIFGTFYIIKLVQWCKKRSCIKSCGCCDSLCHEANDNIKFVIESNAPMLDRQNENESVQSKLKIILNKTVLPDSFIQNLFFVVIYILLLSGTTFWEAFLLEKSSECKTDANFTCFLVSNRSRINCSEYEDTDTDVICYSFAFHAVKGISAAAVAMGISVVSFFVITWLILCIHGTENNQHKNSKSCCNRCRRILTYVFQVLGVVSCVVAIAAQGYFAELGIHQFTIEDRLQFVTFVFVIIAACLMPCWIVSCCRTKEEKAPEQTTEMREIA